MSDVGVRVLLCMCDSKAIFIGKYKDDLSFTPFRFSFVKCLLHKDLFRSAIAEDIIQIKG